MNFVRDYINDEVLDLRARSAIDYEEVVQGVNIYSNVTEDAADNEKDLTEEMKRLQFTWNLTDYRTKEIVIQLDFLNKGELS